MENRTYINLCISLCTPYWFGDEVGFILQLLITSKTLKTTRMMYTLFMSSLHSYEMNGNNKNKSLRFSSTNEKIENNIQVLLN